MVARRDLNTVMKVTLIVSGVVIVIGSIQDLIDSSDVLTVLKVIAWVVILGNALVITFGKPKTGSKQ